MSEPQLGVSASATTPARALNRDDVPGANVLSAKHFGCIHGGLFFAAISNVA